MAAVVTLVPPAVVTVTFTVPDPAGAVAVIWVALSTVKLVAGVPPKLTAVTMGLSITLVKLAPMMVTRYPPAARPLVGDSAVAVGVAGGKGSTARSSKAKLPPSPTVALLDTRTSSTSASALRSIGTNCWVMAVVLVTITLAPDTGLPPR